MCEGESDCWTLWYHSFHALGNMEASMLGCLQAEHLASCVSSAWARWSRFPSHEVERVEQHGF